MEEQLHDPVCKGGLQISSVSYFLAKGIRFITFRVEKNDLSFFIF